MRQASAAHPGISRPGWDESEGDEPDGSVRPAAETSIMQMLCDTTDDAPRVIFVTGPRGAGKTAALENVLARFGQTSTDVLRWHPNAPMPARLHAVLARSSIQGASSAPVAKATATDGSAAVIVAIDDAHLMPLETIRVLRHAATTASAWPVLRLLLVGAPALLAALPRPTLFRRPGGRCAKVSVARSAKRSDARRASRHASKLARAAKRRPPSHQTPLGRLPGTPLGSPSEPLEPGQGAAKPAMPVPPVLLPRRANGPALLLILVLILAFLVGDYLLPASIRPTFLPLLQTMSAPSGVVQDDAIPDDGAAGRGNVTRPPVRLDPPTAPAVPVAPPPEHAAASDPARADALPDGAGTVVVVSTPNSETARKRAAMLAASLETSGLAVERAPAGAPDVIKGVRIGYYFNADRPTAERVRGVLSRNANVAPPVVLPITGPPPRPGTIEITVGEG